MITISRLNELLSLDSETGVFTWKSKRGSGSNAGDVAGKITKYGYVSIKIDQVDYFAHRLVWLIEHGSFPSLKIDHINRIKTDNRISNLREATDSQNAQNHISPQSNNKSGFRGVSPYKGKWKASITKDGKQIYLGLFDGKLDAASAYIVAKQNVHEFFHFKEAA